MHLSLSLIITNTVKACCEQPPILMPFFSTTVNNFSRIWFFIFLFLYIFTMCVWKLFAQRYVSTNAFF